MPFVLDSSVTLAWLLPDEDDAGVNALLDRLATDRASAPSHWPLEIGNALLVARRSKRLGDDDLKRLARHAAALPVAIDQAGTGAMLGAVLEVAEEHGLTTYDAVYVELARRGGCPLATLDKRLAAACKRAGIAVLP